MSNTKAIKKAEQGNRQSVSLGINASFASPRIRRGNEMR